MNNILAATALPRFIDLSTQAKENAAKATLGNIRAAVAIKYAENAINGVTPLFPATITSALFADGIIPKEPYSSAALADDVLTGAATSEINNAGGWFYIPASGQVYLNDTTGGHSSW